MGDDDGGPVGGAVEAQQARCRGAGRQRAEDSGLVAIGGGQRVVVGGRLDEGPLAVGQTERGGELVAAAARGRGRTHLSAGTARSTSIARRSVACASRPSSYRTHLPDGSGSAKIDQNITQALGRSRGGLTCKIHLAGEGGRRPLALLITLGQ